MSDLTTVKLANLNFDRLKLFRGDIHNRDVYVYYDSSKALFYKIFYWPSDKEGYRYGEPAPGLEILEDSITCTAAKELCPLLHGYITNDNNHITGYITRKGKGVREWPEWNHDESKYWNEPHVAEFWQKIKQHTVECRYYHCDLTASHVLQTLDGDLSIIDLESWLPIGLFPNYSKWFSPNKYKRLVESIVTPEDSAAVAKYTDNVSADCWWYKSN